MVPSGKLVHRSVCQLALALLVAVALLVGSLAHNHSSYPAGSQATDRCAACLLHKSVADPPADMVDASRSPGFSHVATFPAEAPALPTLCTLDVAPKTSPPVCA